MLTRTPHHGTDKSPKAMTVGEKGIWGIQDDRASDFWTHQGRGHLEVAEMKKYQAVPFYWETDWGKPHKAVRKERAIYLARQGNWINPVSSPSHPEAHPILGKAAGTAVTLLTVVSSRITPWAHPTSRLTWWEGNRPSHKGWCSSAQGNLTQVTPLKMDYFFISRDVSFVGTIVN